MTRKIGGSKVPPGINVNLAAQKDRRMFPTTGEMGAILCRRRPTIHAKYHILVCHTWPHGERVGARECTIEFLFRGTVHAAVTFGVDIFEEGTLVNGLFVWYKDGLVDGAEVEAVGGAEYPAERVGFAASFAEDAVGREGEYVQRVRGNGETCQVHGQG